MQTFMDWINAFESGAQAALAGLGTLGEVITLVTRFVYPTLALVILVRCLWPLMSGGRKPVPWAYLSAARGAVYPLEHWENSVGSGKNCDIRIDLPEISRTHAVVSRKRGGWYITDLGSEGGVRVNGEPCEGATLIREEDSVELAGISLTLSAGEGASAGTQHERTFAVRAAEVAARFRPGATMFFIILFQAFGALETTIALGERFNVIYPVVFLTFLLLETLYFLIFRRRGKRHIEPELLAFFLCGIGLFVVAPSSADDLFKQFCAVLLGVILFMVLSYFLDNLERVRAARYVFAVGALLLLALNLALAPTRYGAQNWIRIGSLSIQPSEFIKVAFVFAGGATLDQLLTKRNLFKFMAYSAVCIGGLALMRDFGAALIFFLAFLVIAFMRSGDARVIAIVTAVAGMGAFIAVSFMPYIASRFTGWRHAWEYVDTKGYQQTRTMIYTASGGLFGVGPGKGYLRNVVAADTDLVFGVVAEEWGLVVALLCALTPLMLAVFSFMSVKAGRSAFYAIVACGAAVILLAQAALNVFGSLDILPLTGVTLPFVSNGGSSMVACWGLLACIKSIDERHRAQIQPDL